MELVYDPVKNALNVANHGIDFAEAEFFDWDTATFKVDRRKEYGEDRIIAVGYLGVRLHVLVYTDRGYAIRPISFRKANKRERKKYEKEQE